MRGEIREGRFSIDHERGSYITGTTKELVGTVGAQVEWWFFDQENTVVDPIYDVGGSDSTAGRIWSGPILIPVVNASIVQGVTMQNDRGFYNTDVLTVTVNVDLIESPISFKGAVAKTIPQLKGLEINPDAYLRDRITFRHEVWTPTRIYPAGLVKNKYTLISIECNQVNAEEMVNDSQFQHYANYNPFDTTTL